VLTKWDGAAAARFYSRQELTISTAPSQIVRDGVVIRGAGANKTKNLSSLRCARKWCRFLPSATEFHDHKSSWIEAHAKPDDLQTLSILLEGSKSHRPNATSTGAPHSHCAPAPVLF
jgi:hypothetical protein